jgi:hypothetical protein
MAYKRPKYSSAVLYGWATSYAEGCHMWTDKTKVRDNSKGGSLESPWLNKRTLEYIRAESNSSEDAQPNLGIHNPSLH